MALKNLGAYDERLDRSEKMERAIKEMQKGDSIDCARCREARYIIYSDEAVLSGRHSGARSQTANPESRNRIRACIWIPGSLAHARAPE